MCCSPAGMSLALPFSLPIYTGLPATFAVCCLLSALVGLEYLVAVLQVRAEQPTRRASGSELGALLGHTMACQHWRILKSNSWQHTF